MMSNYKEMLVVVFLSSAIMLLGIGATKYGSEQWRLTTCQNNLRKLYKVNLSYQNDNGGYIAPRIDRNKKTRWKYWPQYISSYANENMFFYCPSSHRGEKMFGLDPLEPKVFSLRAVSYGMNYTLGNYKEYKSPGNSRMTKLSQAVTPSYMVFFGDAKTLSLRPTGTCWKTDHAPVHGSKANYLLLDGSVKLIGKDSLGLVSRRKGPGWEGWKLDRKRWINK